MDQHNQLTAEGLQVFDMLTAIKSQYDVCRTLHAHQVGDFMEVYVRIRPKCGWIGADLKVLRPRIVELADIFSQNIGHLLTSDVLSVLTIKSYMFLVSREFPAIAETLLYSPLMEQVDSFIDSWPINKAPVANDDELKEIREMSHLPQFADHSWWKALDNLEAYNGKPFTEYEWAENLFMKHKKTAETLKHFAEQLSGELSTEAHHRNDHFYRNYMYPLMGYADDHPVPRAEERKRLGINYAKNLDDKLMPTVLALTKAHEETMKAARRLDWARAPLRGEIIDESVEFKMFHKFKAAEEMRIQKFADLYRLTGGAIMEAEED